MKRQVDIDKILAPIPGANPAGEDRRYSQIYEDIKEARRADDPLDRGAWQLDIKTSDWDKVKTVAIDVLIQKTKDLQIAAWLSEALIATDGFDGLATGLTIVYGFFKDYWDHVYPAIEEGDMEFRAAPLEFMNEKLVTLIKGIPITDSKVTSGYYYLKWQESRSVGYEADTKNQYGDTDEGKRKRREELIGEGKPDEQKAVETESVEDIQSESGIETAQQIPVSAIMKSAATGSFISEDALWQEALQVMKISGIRKALNQLLTATAPQI